MRNSGRVNVYDERRIALRVTTSDALENNPLALVVQVLFFFAWSNHLTYRQCIPHTRIRQAFNDIMLNKYINTIAEYSFPYNEVLILSVAANIRRVDTLDFDGTVYVDWENKKLVTKKEFKERVASIKKMLFTLTDIESRARETDDFNPDYFTETRAHMFSLSRGKRPPPKLGKASTDLGEIKRNCPITDHIEFNGANMARCIWHREKTASMKYYPKDNHVYCFGCNKHGSVIDVVMAKDNCTFLEALKKLKHGGEDK